MPRRRLAPASAARSETVQPSSTGLRMKDLIRESGLSRETIHFYIAEKLVPPGMKTSRTTSEYTQAHVERLRRIKALREEQFLPLKAVKALLREDSGSDLTGKQHLFLRRADAVVRAVLEEAPDVPFASVHKAALSRRDIELLVENGLILIKGAGRRRTVSSDDADIIETFARLREAGFTRERGYSGDELVVFEHAMDQLVQRELELALRRLTNHAPPVLQDIFESANPFLEHLILVMRRKAFRRRAAERELVER